MEKTGNNPIKINQHDLKIMLQDRILSPKEYVDKPLLMWRANYWDGIIMMQVFLNFEPPLTTLIKQQSEKKPGEGEEIAIPRLLSVKLDKINDKRFFFPAEDLNRVFCFIFDLPDQILNTPPSYEEYSECINTDWLIKAQEWLKAPIVVFLPFLEQPEAFKDYTQYVFTPDYNEWKETLVIAKRQLIKHLAGFLDSSVSEKERNYRWYWYFERLKEAEDSSDLKWQSGMTGCDFPSSWDDGLGNIIGRYILPLAQKPKNYIPRKPTKISDISASDFKAFFKKGISEDVIEDFRNYLIERNAEI